MNATLLDSWEKLVRELLNFSDYKEKSILSAQLLVKQWEAHQEVLLLDQNKLLMS